MQGEDNIKPARQQCQQNYCGAAHGSLKRMAQVLAWGEADWQDFL